MYNGRKAGKGTGAIQAHHDAQNELSYDITRLHCIGIWNRNGIAAGNFQKHD